ncbi:hypothetical protein, partial [Vespertiliibacter pulmonis]|uniref:hypothetical protein n=1 Tax=Vespertiliibacter pulmonis TaxID=1443036 RepID=UPI001B875B0D
GSVGIPHVRVGHHQGFIDNPKVERPWGFCYGKNKKIATEISSQLISNFFKYSSIVYSFICNKK